MLPLTSRVGFSLERYIETPRARYTQPLVIIGYITRLNHTSPHTLRYAITRIPQDLTA